MESSVARIFPDKYLESQILKQNRNLKGGKNGNRCVSAARINHRNKKTSNVKKENRTEISDPSRYYNSDERHKLSHSTRTTLLTNPKSIAEKNKRKSIYDNKRQVREGDDNLCSR